MSSRQPLTAHERVHTPCTNRTSIVTTADRLDLTSRPSVSPPHSRRNTIKLVTLGTQQLDADIQRLTAEITGTNRGTGTRQLANRKAPGYAELVRRQLQRKHFPAATTADFTVLLIVPGPQRRDALRRAFRQLDSATHRTDLWRFVARMDLIAETFLHEEIFYRCEDEPPGPLIRQ